MLRIDEVYNNTFWPYINNHTPLTRMFFCDPPGNTQPESLHNFGNDVPELNYILFHDQEPIHLGLHDALFNQVEINNRDLDNGQGPQRSAIVTSELDSEFVQHVCSRYGWQAYYYFFHGWAALDWYRGYDKTFLMPNPSERNIAKTFIAPNRIIAGMRQHRLEMLYWIFKLGMTDNWISCPAVCPAENTNILDAINPLTSTYLDIKSVFARQKLPISFPGESNSPMHSCWLSLFDECASSLLYLVTETVATGRRLHLTEKIFKPICLQMPFVLVSTAGSLNYLRSYGFKTFGDFWDESYDLETNDHVRIQRIAKLLKTLNDMSQQEKQQLFLATRPIIEHNYQHFYNGGFEKLLWEELTAMLDQIKTDFT